MSDSRSLEQLVADCRERFIVRRSADMPADAPAAATAPRDETPGNATIPESFRWATLEAPELRERLARDRAIAEAQGALSAQGLLFVGPSGSGKTSLACALLRAWEQADPRRRGAFVPAWRLGVVRAQHGLGNGEPPEVERALSTRLLVLDDLGSERNTATNAVPDVLFERAYAGRPTWVTTWMTPEQVSQRYGDGIARRLYEAGRVVVIGCGKGAS
jgi:DNA replication protein DnaC